MFQEFSAFNIEIKNLRFTTDDGLNYPKTVILSFISPNGHSEYVEVLGYLDKGQALILDNCLIKRIPRGSAPG